MTKRKINSAIKHTGLRVEGERGAGCFHFVDAQSGYNIDDSTVWVAYLNQLTLDQWIERAEGVER